MGVPLSLVVAFLKNSNNGIPVNFSIEGDLNNPKFDIKENVMHRISVAMAEKLGLPLKGIPEAVAGVGAKGSQGSGVEREGDRRRSQKYLQGKLQAMKRRGICVLFG